MKTKTMTVSRSSTIYTQSTIKTLDRTVPKECADVVILGVTFDAKITFEKHFRSFQRCCSEAWYGKHWQILRDQSLLLRSFFKFCPAGLRKLVSRVVISCRFTA